MKASYCRYILNFKQPAITSRATMLEKETFFIKLWHEDCPDVYGIGECALFRGLSSDDTPDYSSILSDLCHCINQGKLFDVSAWSSIRFGYETALLDLRNGGRRLIFPSEWSEGQGEIPINGLVWMGSKDEMFRRINEKLRAGFRCLKLKIGGIDFEKELELLRYIRDSFSPSVLEIRLDANGAFSMDNALERLDRLSEFTIHSIEQPIKPGQWDGMAEICEKSPIPIALDEELIGIHDARIMQELLFKIKPNYIILKPALCGGFSGASSWIEQASPLGIGWWVTSALESNIGLNAIAQRVATLDTEMPQGLGTGNLYLNNIPSPLVQERDILRYDINKGWKIPDMHWV